MTLRLLAALIPFCLTLPADIPPIQFQVPDLKPTETARTPIHRERVPNPDESVPPEEREWMPYISDGLNNVEINDRLIEVREILKARMQEVLSHFEPILDEEALALLRANQDAWETVLITKSRFLADNYREGSHAPIAYGYAYLEEQQARIKELKVMYQYRAKW